MPVFIRQTSETIFGLYYKYLHLDQTVYSLPENIKSVKFSDRVFFPKCESHHTKHRYTARFHYVKFSDTFCKEIRQMGRSTCFLITVQVGCDQMFIIKGAISRIKLILKKYTSKRNTTYNV